MEPKAHVPFISPFQPQTSPSKDANVYTRLNILVVVLMIIFLGGMGILAYTFTQPKKPAVVVESTDQSPPLPTDETE